MSKYADITFSHPPITEALLDIRVELQKDFDTSKLELFQKNIEDEYSVKQINTLWETSVQLKVGESPVSIIKDSANGFIFKTPDNTKIVQARKDGFTFNKLKPYTNWVTFKKEAFNLWNLYIKIAKPISVKRLALRYINLIEIPLPMQDFKEYLTTVPEIDPRLPQGLSEFFMRLVIPDSNKENIALINETIDISKLNEKFLPFIFDIDTFRQVNLSPKDPKILKIFESLREYKNYIFINSMTEKAIQLFK